MPLRVPASERTSQRIEPLTNELETTKDEETSLSLRAS